MSQEITDIENCIHNKVANLCGKISQLQAENKSQYRKGYEDGLRAYAWWKDGIQYVGSCGTTLEQALRGSV